MPEISNMTRAEAHTHTFALCVLFHSTRVPQEFSVHKAGSVWTERPASEQQARIKSVGRSFSTTWMIHTVLEIQLKHCG